MSAIRIIASILGVLILGVANVSGVTQVVKPKSRLVTLGTRSGPFPTAVRAQSSNALIIGNAVYLVDAGDGATRRLARAGIPIRNIDAIFLTHLHDDHTSGLIALMAAEWNLDRKENVGIYGPPETQTLVAAALRFLDVNASIRLTEGTRTIPLAPVFTAHDVEAGLIYKDTNLTVRGVENDHFHFPAGSPAYGKTKSYSYRFETLDRTIVFTGDTGPRLDAVTELARGADLLITEVSSVDELVELRKKDGSWARWTPQQQVDFIHHITDEHLSAEDVGKMASRAGVKAVVLTHLPASLDARDRYQRYVDAVRKGFSGKVLVAEDLGEF